MASAATTAPARDRTRDHARNLWEADRTRLMMTQPFLALLAMQLDLIPISDPRLPTAATDGRSIFVDIDFLLDLDRDDRLFVLAHEVWHCAARHFLRRGNREPERWNLAIDHEVNALLQEQGLRVPDDAVLYPEMIGHNAETVYDWIGKRRDRIRSRAPWADAHNPLPAPDADSDPDCNPGPGDWKAWPARVIAAVQQAERRQGTVPTAVHRLVRFIRNPQLPWQEILRGLLSRGLNRERQWTPPNRRFVAQGLYLPGYSRQPRLDIAVAIDTSGSTRRYLEYFLSELNGIVSAFGDYRLRLLQCNAAIQIDAIYTPSEPLDPDALEMIGGGGTDFRPIFECLRGSEPPHALVLFTDGKGTAPQEPPDYPVLWVLTGPGRRPVSWGQVVDLETRE